MLIIYLLLAIVAAVLFAVAAYGKVATRFNLIAAGLFFWVLIDVIRMLVRVA